jgi:hypothetical protein
MIILTEQDKNYIKHDSQLVMSTIVDPYTIKRLSILGTKPIILLFGTWDFSSEDNSALILTI